MEYFVLRHLRREKRSCNDLGGHPGNRCKEDDSRSSTLTIMHQDMQTWKLQKEKWHLYSRKSEFEQNAALGDPRPWGEEKVQPMPLMKYSGRKAQCLSTVSQV